MILPSAGALPIDRFSYELPEELIAQTPIEPRDASRLLVIDRAGGNLRDHHFRDLPHLLAPGDLLVLNDTRVIPGRLRARRATGGEVELLLLDRRDDGRWTALARPLRRLRRGESLMLIDHTGDASGSTVMIEERDSETVELRFVDEGTISEVGTLPLPPYIRQALVDPERYQTVFATRPGSAAAPTAGLHFTEDLLREFERAGVRIETITLHVGRDTFQPVRDADARKHTMHAEAFDVSTQTLDAVAATRRNGGRVVAVGTTSVRTLESIADRIESGSHDRVAGSTRLYITPGYHFRVVNAVLTNFHLPRTTLLLLASAFAGWPLIQRAYQHAINERYRFYSFGDATLIV